MVGSAGSRGGRPGLYWYAARTLNFSVTGAGIEKIAYTLEGDVVGFPEGAAEETPLERPYAYLDALYNHPDQVGDGEAYPDHGGTLDGFTVDYAGQEQDQDDFNRQIWTHFPTDDELEELYRQQNALFEARDGTYESELADRRASNAFWSAVERRSIDVLMQLTLALTVTFENGETKTSSPHLTRRTQNSAPRCPSIRTTPTTKRSTRRPTKTGRSSWRATPTTSSPSPS